MNSTAPYWRRPQILFAAALVLALLVTIVMVLPRRQTPAPDVSFTLVDGSKLFLKDLRGKPVLVFFWATTCSTCIAKTPEMNRLYRELQPQGLEMVAVAMPYDPPTRVVAFAKKLEMPYPVALDHRAEIVRAFGDVRVTPTTFLITADGTIAWRKPGKLDTARLGATISQMIRNPKAAL
jgi:peroxiredoxin